MRVAYLLPGTDISASARIVVAQADALIARGHQVRIVTAGLPLTWRSSRAEWVFVDDLARYAAEAGEVLVDSKSPIVASNPIVDDDVYRDRLPRENTPLRVLLAGGAQIEEKGIGEGYGAVAHARWFHQSVDLVRLSPWAPSRDEPLDSVQEFHVALTARETTRLIHSCDVVIAPNRREDPLSLTTLEALAAGLAGVLTTTPAHLAIGDDVAMFGPPDNAVELGEALMELAGDSALRQRVRARAREVAENWRAENVAKRLETLL